MREHRRCSAVAATPSSQVVPATPRRNGRLGGEAPLAPPAAGRRSNDPLARPNAQSPTHRRARCRITPMALHHSAQGCPDSSGLPWEPRPNMIYPGGVPSKRAPRMKPLRGIWAWQIPRGRYVRRHETDRSFFHRHHRRARQQRLREVPDYPVAGALSAQATRQRRAPGGRCAPGPRTRPRAGKALAFSA